MRLRRGFNCLIPLLLWLCVILLVFIASANNYATEKFYTQKIYLKVIPFYSHLFGWLPFSVGELFIYALSALLLFVIFRLGRKWLVHRDKPKCLRLTWWLVTFLGVLYLAFLLLWGLNYYRLSWAQIAHLDTRNPTADELITLTERLARDANRQRARLTADNWSASRRSIVAQAPRGYIKAAEVYPAFRGKWGQPKLLLFSRVQTLAGIAGFYMPFTAEPNINHEVPYALLPATAMHEIAHQHGFAREGEANYLAYLTSQFHPSPLFNYSGTLLAFIYSANSLKSHDPKAYQKIFKSLKPEVRNDLKKNQDFWSYYQGPLTNISDSINNWYLKANRQKKGIASYGQVVDLLLAEQRKNKQ